MVSVVEDMQRTTALVLPTFNYVQQQKSKVEARAIVANSGATFAEQTSIVGLPEDFKIQVVVTYSDLTAEDVVLMLQFDKDSLDDVLQLGLQMPLKMKLPVQFLVQAVLEDFMKLRLIACGRRLNNFKANGGLLSTGALVFLRKTGCYDMNFDADGKLTEVVHMATSHSCSVDPASGLNKAYKLRDNHDYRAAALVMPGLRPIFLHEFFSAKEQTGPYHVASYHSKPRDLEKAAAEAHDSWSIKRNETEASDGLHQDAQVVINAHRAQKRTAAMQKAREAATTVLAKKKARKTVALA